MLDWVKMHQAELGEYAIELTGGDDEMLFSAGLCYASFPCRLYNRRLDGRYIALPSGEEIRPGSGRFTVAQRLRLHDAELERYGRLTPADLTSDLIELAHRLLALQKKHQRLWTAHTTCFQRCAAKANHDGLTLLLDNKNCREQKVTAENGKLLHKLLRAGALTKIEPVSDGILVTFASRLIRDCLCDFGVWLEIVTYDALRSCGQFDDVQLSCVVRWENETLINELDVIATSGLGLMIVSCKTCAPDIKAIAELNVLGDRLGAAHTQTTLLSLPRPNERLDHICARCEEMGVDLVDLRQFDRPSLIAYFRRAGEKLRIGRRE